MQISPNDISVNPYQPRRKFSDAHINELVESIKIYGIIQPLIVTKKEDGGYELIAGERRWRSAKKLELPTVPVIIRNADAQEKLELALIENIQRQDLNPIETAISYRKLVDEFNLTQIELAGRVSKSRSSVANSLRLLNLPEEIQDALSEGRISEGHGKIILGQENEVKHIALFRKILHDGMSVSDTSIESKVVKTSKSKIEKPVNYQDKDKELVIREYFGAKAEIKRKGLGGQVVIDFYSDDELEEIMNKLK
jgi:ParB family chromosome partitioning protein